MKLNYRTKKIILLFLSAMTLTLLFQNCSNRNFTSQESASTSLSSLSLQSMDCSIGGETTAENNSKMFFLASSVPYGSTCKYENRVCTRGYFEGTYQYSTCEVGVAESCLFNGATIPHGGSVKAYQSSTVPYGQTCVQETHICSNGVLSAMKNGVLSTLNKYEFASCAVGQPASCLFDGTTVAHGVTVTANKTREVAYGSTCQKEQRTCSNGSFTTGTYQFKDCAAAKGKSCTLYDGFTVEDGGSIIAYSTQSISATARANCTDYDQNRTCTNGIFNGSSTYKYSSCKKGT